MYTLPLALLCSPATDPLRAPSWDVDPQQVEGTIRVAPLLLLTSPPAPVGTGLMDEPLARADMALRRRRAEELAWLPYALHDAVPGALYAALPAGWSGHFTDVNLGPGARRDLERALGGGGDPLDRMARAAARAGGDATLFVWVRHTQGQPLTSTTPVGELVMAEGVPVVVDRATEPYTVQVQVGVALVAADGALLFRSEDALDGMLLPEVPVQALALGMARELVGGIAPLWLGETHGVALVEER